MTRKDQKHYKKLIGVYKQCIDASYLFNNTKYFRKLTGKRIDKVLSMMNPET